MADSGRSSVLDSQTDAYVKTTGGNYVNLAITKGLYTQENVSDARVNLYVPTQGSEGYNQSISLSVWNAKSNPVAVDVNVTVDGTESGRLRTSRSEHTQAGTTPSTPGSPRCPAPTR